MNYISSGLRFCFLSEYLVVPFRFDFKLCYSYKSKPLYVLFPREISIHSSKPDSDSWMHARPAYTTSKFLVGSACAFFRALYISNFLVSNNIFSSYINKAEIESIRRYIEIQSH